MLVEIIYVLGKGNLTESPAAIESCS